MNEESADRTEKVTDTEQLITDIKAVISRIKLLRIRIALYLLLTEVPPPLRGGELPSDKTLSKNALYPLAWTAGDIRRVGVGTYADQ